MIRIPTRPNWLFYSDANLQAEIWKAARQNDGIRTLDIDSFSVFVKDGFVSLTGHLSQEYHRNLIEQIACSLPGVHGIDNQLIVDTDLTIQIAARLAQDERLRPLILPVGCAHGWVRVGGVVPRRELQRAAEEIAAQVPLVRGVLSRPRVVGESPETERRPIQTWILAKVYDYNLQVGVVSQVVIEPRNRLVTHAVISASGFQDGKFVFYEYLVPVEALEVVNKESILLKRNGPPLSAFPAFEPEKYPLAPADWQPPYPYAAEDVRWSCEQREGAADRSGVRLQG